jgi:hypothetical protein
MQAGAVDQCELLRTNVAQVQHRQLLHLALEILSIEFSIPYLLNDENYPIGGWAIELSIWVRALEDAGHGRDEKMQQSASIRLAVSTPLTSQT